MSRVGFSSGLGINSRWFVLLTETTTHLLMKESLHATDDSKPHRIGLRYTSIPYSLTINVCSRKYRCRKRKGKQSVFRSKEYNYQWSAFLTSIFVIKETDKRTLCVRQSGKRISYNLFMIPTYKSYRFPSSFSAEDEHHTAGKYSQVNKPQKQ